MRGRMWGRRYDDGLGVFVAVGVIVFGIHHRQSMIDEYSLTQRFIGCAFVAKRWRNLRRNIRDHDTLCHIFVIIVAFTVVAKRWRNLRRNIRDHDTLCHIFVIIVVVAFTVAFI